MIEKTIYDYLNDQGIAAFMQKPKNPPSEYVLLEKTGSSRTNYINSATIALQSYADSLYSAALLNEEVKRAMDDSVVLDEICSASLNSDYNFTDTTTKEFRYQAVYDVTHY